MKFKKLCTYIAGLLTACLPLAGALAADLPAVDDPDVMDRVVAYFHDSSCRYGDAAPL